MPMLWLGPVQAATDPEVPDLCTEDVYLAPNGVPLEDANGTMLSKYCTWTDQDAPAWTGEVCCELGPDSASCTPTNTRGECQTTQVKRRCDYAKSNENQVVCLQPFPSACDSGVCAAPPRRVQVDPQATSLLCCFGGACYEVAFGEDCGGLYQWCESPYTNEDGTVGCAD
ncbi:hypothetical protein [Enhygromyxa salina]|nr:hypothetical protein [Enhygromyxa salina]